MYGKKLLFMVALGLCVGGCKTPTLQVDKEELTGLPRCRTKNNNLDIIQNAASAALELERNLSTEGNTLKIIGRLYITKRGYTQEIRKNPEVEFLINGENIKVRSLSVENLNYTVPGVGYEPPRSYILTTYKVLIEKNLLEKMLKAPKVLVRVQASSESAKGFGNVLLKVTPENVKLMTSFYESCVLKTPE